MAEWLRREIRNLMGSARVGSNPSGVVHYIYIYIYIYNIRDGVVGNISPCHGDARGSIPRCGV